MLLNIGIINLPPTTGSVPWRRRKTTLTFIKCVHGLSFHYDLPWKDERHQNTKGIVVLTDFTSDVLYLAAAMVYYQGHFHFSFIKFLVALFLSKFALLWKGKNYILLRVVQRIIPTHERNKIT